MIAENTLFGHSIRKRPTRAHPSITRRAAELLYDQMVDYEIDRGEATSREKILRHIMEAIESSDDGYARAQVLERQGWYADSRVVEWLSDDTVEDAYRELVQAWVRDEGIRPSLEVGALVQIARQRSRHPGESDTVDGEIVRVDHEMATYTVMVPEYGHVRTGIGTHGYVLPYEEVEPD